MSTTNTDYHDVLNNIQRLQATEKQLHSDLKALPPSVGADRQQLLVNQINDISRRKINLFKHLFSVNSQLQENIDAGNAELKAKLEIAQIVERQLEAAKARMADNRAQNVNNLRLTKN